MALLRKGGRDLGDSGGSTSFWRATSLEGRIKRPRRALQRSVVGKAISIMTVFLVLSRRTHGPVLRSLAIESALLLPAHRP